MTAGPLTYQYVYGPVPSRRLGRSLGIDLVPYKTCTYDCIYCQLGCTTDKTVERREYVPVDAVVLEVERALSAGARPDYISLAGSGEPTLHSGVGELVGRIKSMTDVPLAMITNGSLLWMKKVQEDLLSTDLVLPSLDAGDAETFQRVNRPEPTLSFDQMVDGLIGFTKRFGGEVRLEVMLLAGITDTLEQVNKIASIVRKIAPARVQLNTASRPPAEGFALPVPQETMTALAGLFAGEVDVICDFVAKQEEPSVVGETTDAQILALVGRRPCTAEDIAAGLELHVLDVFKHLDILLAQKRILMAPAGEKTFYALADPSKDPKAP